MRGEDETVFLDDIPGRLADPEKVNTISDISISDNGSQSNGHVFSDWAHGGEVSLRGVKGESLQCSGVHTQ